MSQDKGRKNRVRIDAAIRDKAMTTQLSVGMTDASDYCTFCERATEAIAYIDQTYFIALQLYKNSNEICASNTSTCPITNRANVSETSRVSGSPHPTITSEDVYRWMEDMNELSRRFTEHWMIHMMDIDNEAMLTAGDALGDRLPVPALSFCISSLACVSEAALSHALSSVSVQPERCTDPHTKVQKQQDPPESMDCKSDRVQAVPDDVNRQRQREERTRLRRRWKNVMFSELDGFKFDILTKGFLVQTDKKIYQYGPTDIIALLEAITHAWHRIEITQELLDLILAIRLRCGMLLRYGSPYVPDDPLSLRKISMYFRDPAKVASETVLCIPSSKFQIEVSQRVGAFLEVFWIEERHYPQWNRNSALSRIKRYRISNNITEATTSYGTGIPPEFDPVVGEIEVLTLLRRYAEEMSGSGTIRDSFSRIALSMSVGPGEERAFSARFPYMLVTVENILRRLRGRKFMAGVREYSMSDPVSILRSKLEKVKKEYDSDSLSSVQQTTDSCSSGKTHIPIGSRLWKKRRRSMDDVIADIACLCTFDLIMKSKYNVEWSARYVFTRTTYRQAIANGYIGEHTLLPVILIYGNTFDLIYAGHILKTNSLFESIAWWLEIIRVEYFGKISRKTESLEHEISVRELLYDIIPQRRVTSVQNNQSSRDTPSRGMNDKEIASDTTTDHSGDMSDSDAETVVVNGEQVVHDVDDVDTRTTTICTRQQQHIKTADEEVTMTAISVTTITRGEAEKEGMTMKYTQDIQQLCAVPTLGAGSYVTKTSGREVSTIEMSMISGIGSGGGDNTYEVNSLIF